MKNIIFQNMQFNYRGTSVSTFSLAKYNEEILGNKSIIIGTKQREMDSYKLFNDHFKTILLESDWNPIDNTTFRNEIESKVEQEKADWYYVQIGGEADSFFPTNCKTFINAVFNMRCPQGDIYAGISEYLMKRDGGKLFLPYIVEKPVKDLYIENDYRYLFNINKEALVIGCYAGSDQFNIGFVHETIKKIVTSRKDIYFIFMGINPFCEQSEQIRFYNKTTNLFSKQLFINTCDAMIHARSIGETMGLAVGEFSVSNKPIITYNGDLYSYYDRAHIDILKDKGIYYKNAEELYSIFSNISKLDIDGKDWNMYQDFSGEKVIKKFEQLIS